MRPSTAKEFRRWGLSLLLFLPVIVLYACEYLRGNGRSFTGFIQYDQAYYMANARKVFEGGFHFLYGNPFSPDPDTPRIYFHLHLLVLGLLQHVTGCDPGRLYVIFGFCAGLVCVRVAMALYEHVAGLDTGIQKACLVLFAWGGGVLALAGLAYHVLHGDDFHATVTDLFHLDPAQGWWFLNFGRNLVFPTEAYYHALFLGAVLLVMRNRFRGAVWLVLALSLSHPFTGLQLLLVLLAWCVVETGVLHNRSIPLRFSGILLGLLLFHLTYNLILLNLFPEHRVLFGQWSVAWNEPASAVIPADLLVALLAWRAVRTRKMARDFFATPANRLLLVWFVVSFALAHHNLLTAPKQPLHFTRGYTWIPLFLLGVQPLQHLLEATCRLKHRLFRLTALSLIFLVGLSDNLAWFGLHIAMALAPRWGIAWLSQDGFSLSPGDRQLYAWLNHRSGLHDELLVTPNTHSPLLYLATVYTDYRAWYSHYGSTPFAQQRQLEINGFFQNDVIPLGWRGRNLFVILPKTSAEFSNRWEENTVYKSSDYRVVFLSF